MAFIKHLVAKQDLAEQNLKKSEKSICLIEKSSGK